MNRKAMCRVFASINLFFCVTGAFADTYWVSPTGTATWSNARSQTPLSGTSTASVATMNANVSAGDTVYLRQGTYNYSTLNGSHISLTRKNGLPGNMITISNYGSESVLFKGIYGTRMWGLTIGESSYIKINGIVFSDYSDYLICASSHHIEISHCTFRNDTSPYRRGTFQMVEASLDGQTVDQPVSQIWIHDSVFYRLEAGGSTCTDEGGDALRIGYHSQICMGGTCAKGLNSHITIENNYMAFAGHAVFDNYGIYTVIRNNVSHNEPWYPKNPGACSPTFPAIYTNSKYNGLYGHRNWQISDTHSRDLSYNLYEGNRLGHAGVNPNNDGATNLCIAAPGNIIRYNAMYNAMHNNMKTKWGESYGWQASGGCRNRIYNNTLYRNGYGYPGFESSFPSRPLRGFRYYQPGDNPGNVLKNNIVYGSYAADHGLDDIQSNTSNPPSIEVNNWTTKAGHGASGWGDPLFIYPDLTQTDSLTLPDLNLQQSSPAIDGGIHLTQTVGGGNNSTTLIVEDALYFQDGTWGCELANQQADWIAIGTTDNIAQIASINYDTNAIRLMSNKTWSAGAKIWLIRKSDGVQVLYGAAPDFGAYEYQGYPSSVRPLAPSGLRVVE